MNIESIKQHTAPFVIAGITAAATIKLLAGRSIFLVGCLVPATITPMVGSIIAIATIITGLTAAHFLTQKNARPARMLFGIVTALFAGTLLYGAFSPAVTIIIPTLAVSILFDESRTGGIFAKVFPTPKN